MVSIIIALIVCLCSSSVVLGVAAMVANSTVALRREQSRLEADKMRYAIEFEHARTEKLRALKDTLNDVAIDFTLPSQSTQNIKPGALTNYINEALSRILDTPNEQYQLNEQYKRRLRT